MKPVALITGATGAISKAIAGPLALTGKYEVVPLCRNRNKAERTVEELRTLSGNPAVAFAVADLSRKASIDTVAATWRNPLQVLINNAALAPRTRHEAPEGIELQFATNVLEYYWLTAALEPWFPRAAGARVVNVASHWAGNLDLQDPEFKHRPYDQHQAYRQSKQADRMLTVTFAERFRHRGITINACHSGDVPSALSHALDFGRNESAEQGARPPVADHRLRHRRTHRPLVRTGPGNPLSVCPRQTTGGDTGGNLPVLRLTGQATLPASFGHFRLAHSQ